MEVETIRANDHVGMFVDCHKRDFDTEIKIESAARRGGHACKRGCNREFINTPLPDVPRAKHCLGLEALWTLQDLWHTVFPAT